MSDQRVNDVSARIYESVIDRLKGTWQSRLSEVDHALVRACAIDAGDLLVRAMAAPNTPEAAEALKRDKAQINAQIANLSAAAELKLQDQFWKSVQAAIGGAVSVVMAVV